VALDIARQPRPSRDDSGQIGVDFYRSRAAIGKLIGKTRIDQFTTRCRFITYAILRTD